MSADFTRFKSVTAMGDSLISDQLESNIIAFFDWGFLQAGGFFNVQFPQRGTQLRRVSDPDYSDGQVWEAYRKNWVWETGVPAPGTQPLAVSGVWVNNAFRPLGSGYHIDYPGGRVVFDTALAAGSTVKLEFAFHRVSMQASDTEWFQQLQFNTLDLEDASVRSQFEEVASGAWNVLAQNRVQLPAIVVEAVNRVRLTGLEIGSAARVHEQDVLFHVLAETPFDRKQLHDIIVAQWDHRLQLFDVNAVDDADAWPLDANGSPRPSGEAMTYPELVAPPGEGGFRWRVCAITGMRSEPQTSLPPLYRATCRGTFEVDLG